MLCNPLPLEKGRGTQTEETSSTGGLFRLPGSLPLFHTAGRSGGR